MITKGEMKMWDYLFIHMKLSNYYSWGTFTENFGFMSGKVDWKVRSVISGCETLSVRNDKRFYLSISESFNKH